MTYDKLSFISPRHKGCKGEDIEIESSNAQADYSFFYPPTDDISGSCSPIGKRNLIIYRMNE